jgi:hypothetical protein
MSAELLYSEILDEYKKLQTKEERIFYLRKQEHFGLLEFLKCVFHPKIIFDVIIPEYRPAIEPAGLNFTYLDMEMKKVYRFIKSHPGRPAGLSADRQTSLLKNVLESLHKDEAELMIKMIHKNLGIEELNKKIVKEAFPNLDLG